MSEDTLPAGGTKAALADIEEAMKDVVDPELGINVVDELLTLTDSSSIWQELDLVEFAARQVARYSRMTICSRSN